MEISIKRPLFIGCHPDDNIIGCGGILSRLSQSSDEFHCYTFSCNNESRKTEWEKGMKGHVAYSGGEWHDDRKIIDDRCIIVNVKGKGLVIVSGCSHAGIVNMIQHSIVLTSEKRVEAVIGGLHLSNASDSDIESTTNSIKEINPRMMVPTHCTGWKAQTHMQTILKQLSGVKTPVFLICSIY